MLFLQIQRNFNEAMSTVSSMERRAGAAMGMGIGRIRLLISLYLSLYDNNNNDNNYMHIYIYIYILTVSRAYKAYKTNYTIMINNILLYILIKLLC